MPTAKPQGHLVTAAPGPHPQPGSLSPAPQTRKPADAVPCRGAHRPTTPNHRSATWTALKAHTAHAGSTWEPRPASARKSRARLAAASGPGTTAREKVQTWWRGETMATPPCGEAPPLWAGLPTPVPLPAGWVWSSAPGGRRKVQVSGWAGVSGAVGVGHSTWVRELSRGVDAGVAAPGPAVPPPLCPSEVSFLLNVPCWDTIYELIYPRQPD